MFLGQDNFSIGTWRDHLPYSKINELATLDNIVYGSTPYSLVEFNLNTNEITKYSTINGLSETGISGIVANESQNTLVIAYESSNIDLIRDDNIINFSAILNSNIIGDKSIYELYSKDRFVYVCTGFGIVVIDLNKKEVKDTYIIGDNNTQVPVIDIHIDNDSIYALTTLDIKSAPLSSNFLSDANSWQTINTPIEFTNLESFSEGLLAYGEQNIVYNYYNGSWDTLICDTSQNIRNLRYADNQLMIATNNSYLTIYSTDIQDSLYLDTINLIWTYDGEFGVLANDVQKVRDFYWIADDKKGLQRLWSNWISSSIINNGPFRNDAFHLSSGNGKLYVSSGTTDGTNWNKTYNWHGVYEYDNESWNMYNQITDSTMFYNRDTVSDLIWSTPHPTNKGEFFASSFGGGLLHFQNGQLKNRFSYYNSSLQTRIGDPRNLVFVAGTDFDIEGNLWVSNPFTDSPLSVMNKNGEWKSFYCGSLVTNNLCTDLVVDNQYGYIWMVVKGVGILVYDYNQTPMDETDDQYKIIGTASGTGSLPSSFVNCLSIDNDGEIWIGTEKGPVVMYSSYPIFNDVSYDTQRILIELNGTLQNLLENESINDIVVDGANRKWIATNGGGLFLMSEDGTETIFSFSTLNSPLFTNAIKSLSIDNESGELYIATELGILGYRSSSTLANETFGKLEVFPNPVQPDYFGNIGIKGMMNNSEVKITNSNGILIKTIFSNGGQAVWDGKDSFNNNVSSGVYYIFSSSEDGFSKAKTKVLVIR